MARAYGSRAQLAVAFEGTYGTAPASGFWRMPFGAAGVGAERGLDESELLGYGRDPLAPTRGVTDVSGEVTVPVDVQAIGVWLKALLGAPTTTGAEDPYTHTWSSGAASLPSLAIERQMPDAAQFGMMAGVKADSLSLSMQRGERVNARITLMGQSETSAGTTQAGSLATDWTVERFLYEHGKIQREGSDLANIVSAELTYANGLEAVETLRQDSLIAGLDPTMASLTGRLTARFDDGALQTQAEAGGVCTLAFALSRGAGRTLTITAHEVRLTQPRLAVEGPGGVQVTYDWVASLDAAEAEMASFVLVNDVAGYPAA
jgi:hypothetical protein